ncbi:MAG: T9SS type A sorting domain-containing protein, partial [Flavobacteriales bacterium]
GYNFTGALGNGNTTDSFVPVQTLLPPGVVAVDGGWDFGIARLSDGTLWAWGENGNGQLGIGDNQNIAIPQPVQGRCLHTTAVAEATAPQQRPLLSPNPTSGTCTVSLAGAGYNATLRDLTGRVVLQRTGLHQQSTLELAAVPDGIYLVLSHALDGRTWTERLVKAGAP